MQCLSRGARGFYIPTSSNDWRMRLVPQDLDQALNCPRRAWFDVVSRESGRVDSAPDAVVEEVVRRTLSSFYGTKRSARTRSMLTADFQRHWAEVGPRLAGEEGLESPPEFWEHRALRMLNRYFDKADWKDVPRAKSLSIGLDLSSDIHLLCRIDRLDCFPRAQEVELSLALPGSARAVFYSFEEDIHEASESLRWSAALVAPCVALQRHLAPLGITLAGADVEFMSHGGEVRAWEFGRNDFEEMLDWVYEIAWPFADGPWPEPTPDPLLCSGCPYLALCADGREVLEGQGALDAGDG